MVTALATLMAINGADVAIRYFLPDGGHGSDSV
jgi:hypothetical protein